MIRDATTHSLRSFILINRYELIECRASARDEPREPRRHDSLTFGYRYYPFISAAPASRFHNEYSIVRQRASHRFRLPDVTSSRSS